MAFGGAIASGQGTAFTYQGRLTEYGVSVDGRYDFTFSLFGVSNGGSPLTGAGHDQHGRYQRLFTVTLDFGAGVFDGASRWLEIGVRPYGYTGTDETLLPRQQITSTP